VSTVLEKVERKVLPLQKLAAIVAVFSAIGGVYWFYKEKIWIPSVSVIKADYAAGTADLLIGGKPKKLYKDSIIHAGAAWGIKMSYAPNRIELLKNGMVKKIIAQS